MRSSTGQKHFELYQTKRFNDTGGLKFWESIAALSGNIGKTTGIDGSLSSHKER